MKTCERCESDVSDTFHRVNCDNEGRLWSCTECVGNGLVLSGPDDRRNSAQYDRNLDKVKLGLEITQFKR